MPQNPVLTIDRDKAEFHLARLKANPEQDAANRLKDLLESRMPEVELIDALIDVDNETDFLHHFLHSGGGRRVSPLYSDETHSPHWSPSVATSVRRAWLRPPA